MFSLMNMRNYVKNATMMMMIIRAANWPGVETLLPLKSTVPTLYSPERDIYISDITGGIFIGPSIFISFNAIPSLPYAASLPIAYSAKPCAIDSAINNFIL